MYETVQCPNCTRSLELSAEHLGKEVQCPSCQSAFTAGEARPQPKSEPMPSAAISAAPPVAPPEDDDRHPRYRRPRHLDVSKPPPAGKRS